MAVFENIRGEQFVWNAVLPTLSMHIQIFTQWLCRTESHGWGAAISKVGCPEKRALMMHSAFGHRFVHTL